MQIGIMDTALGTTSPAEALELAAEVGAAGVELTFATDKDGALLGKSDHLRQLVELSRSAGVALPSICLAVLNRRASLVGTAEQIAAAKEIVRTAITSASEAGIRIILVPFFGKNIIEVTDEFKQYGAKRGEGPWLYQNQELLERARMAAGAAGAG